MPRYLADVRGKVCVWSTIAGAPVSPFFASKGHLLVWAIDTQTGYRTNRRMTEAEVVACNRAGPGKTCIGAQELLERYRDE